MGSTVGFISGAVGGVKATLRPTGNIFEPNEKNMHNLKQWYRYIFWDQTVIWGGGALIGMCLTVTSPYTSCPSAPSCRASPSPPIRPRVWPGPLGLSSGLSP